MSPNDPFDLNSLDDLPGDVSKSLSAKVHDEMSVQIVRCLETAGRKLNADEFVVGFFRLFEVKVNRRTLMHKLNQMHEDGRLTRDHGKKYPSFGLSGGDDPNSVTGDSNVIEEPPSADDEPEFVQTADVKADDEAVDQVEIADDEPMYAEPVGDDDGFDVAEEHVDPETGEITEVSSGEMPPVPENLRRT